MMMMLLLVVVVVILNSQFTMFFPEKMKPPVMLHVDAARASAQGSQGTGRIILLGSWLETIV
jgi:hypothetical protein